MTSASIRSWRLWSRLWPLVVICALALAFMWRPVLRGEVFLPLDALMHLHPWRYSYERVPVNNPNNLDPIRQAYPRRLLANDMVKQGAWPLWNQSILTGTPLLADSQLAFFYPLSVLFLILPLPQAFGYYAFAHLIIAGVGASIFARQLGLGKTAATLSGACYMLNCYMLTWLQLPAHVGATAWLPWCFWSIERACLGAGWRPWALAGALLALPLLCHPQLAFYIYFGSGCYVLARLLMARGWPRRAQIAIGFGMAVALALALSAVQLLPSIALSAQGQRDEIGALFRADYSQLLRLVLPAIGGTPRVDAPSGWGPALLQVPYPYMGLVPLALALLALLLSRHMFSTLFGLMAVLSFALASGSPLLYLFTLLIPPYRQFEDHSRWYILWGFAIALLAGVGLEALGRGGEQHKPGASRVRLVNRVLLGIVLCGVLAWSWFELQLFTPQSRYGFYITLIRQQSLAFPVAVAMLGALLLALAWARRVPQVWVGGLLIAVIFVDLAWNGGSYNTSVDPAIVRPTRDLAQGLAAYAQPDTSSNVLYPPTRQIAFLEHQQQPFRVLGSDQNILPPNIAGAFGLEDIRAYQSLYSARYNRLARMIDDKDYTRTSEGNISLRLYFTSAYKHRRLLDMLNVAFVIFPPQSRDAALYEPLQLVDQNDEGSIYRNPQVLPRAWLVHAVEVMADDNAQLARMSRPDFDPASLAILATPAPQVAPALTTELTPTVAYAPNQVRIQASASAPALLVLSDAYSDGWQATVDGRDAPIYRANYAFRGVWLPAGAHTILFTYRPQSFFVGSLVSLIALLLLAGTAGWLLRAIIRSSLTSRRGHHII